MEIKCLRQKHEVSSWGVLQTRYKPQLWSRCGSTFVVPLLWSPDTRGDRRNWIMATMDTAWAAERD